eukprot:9088881-Lingulodinium_polyedra.AAC.1
MATTVRKTVPASDVLNANHKSGPDTKSRRTPRALTFVNCESPSLWNGPTAPSLNSFLISSQAGVQSWKTSRHSDCTA